MRQALRRFISDNTIPKPDANTLYFIYTPPNVTCIAPAGQASCAAVNGICGYHSSDNSGPDPARRYAVMPYLNCPNCLLGVGTLFEVFTVVSSHELCETITDPDLNTWADPVTTNEIGDICNRDPVMLGSYMVQTEWSNSRARCAVSPFRFSPGITINAVDRTPEPVAACEFEQKLILFWKADDTSNSIYFSPSFNGHTWPNGQKINPVDSTPKAPAACAYRDKLFLFWKANDDSNAIYFSRSDDGLTWPIGTKINNVDSTPESLAACVFGDLLYLFWKANDDSNTIYFSTYDGVTWTNGKRINNVDSTPKPLAACVAGNPLRLHLFWKANDDSYTIYFSTYDGVTWTNGKRINNIDSTPLSLAARSFNDDAFLFWKGNDGSNSIYIIASPDGSSWPAGIKVNNIDHTPCALACCVFGSTQLLLFWRADDDSHSIYFSTFFS